MRGITLLQRAEHLQPDHPAIQSELGRAYLAAGNFEGALRSLRLALKAVPEAADVRLYLGYALEQLGREHEALIHYFGAIIRAQNIGQWQSEEGTAAELRPLVGHAMRYVNTKRRALFQAVVEPLRNRYGAQALMRVEKCLLIYLGDLAPEYPDARQRPTFLYFPDLPTQPCLGRESVPWMEMLEAHTGPIREELLQVLASSANLEPVHKQLPPEQRRRYVTGASSAASWDAYYFYRHGERYEENCRRCPLTASVLEQLPTPRIREHAPEIMFSVLKPGTHILPHYGVTNTRVVAHLPLIVPDDCALRVGGEIVQWQEGRGLVFEDTFEHEAWNRSAETRAILIVDVWNPYLTEVERMAIADLIGAIGDFNRECGI